ncbi:MAG TPA: hemolysin family protein [Vicinamibacterales bacterium]|jgi:CBS domain containing-hemolysin-like protein|nr:hemolysin family protein [Vicinamibacterales bacterium]
MVAAAGVILLLIAVTGFYVAAEFGAVGVRRSRLRRLCEDGNPTAARLLPVVEDPQRLNRYIAASQVGITLSGLALGAYAGAVISPVVAPVIVRVSPFAPNNGESLASAIVLVSLTILSVIIGEMVPKTVALRYPTEIALLTTRPMLWSARAYAWFIVILDRSAAILRQLLRVPTATHRHVHSPEEIGLMIAESRNGGLLEPQEQVRLHRALRLGLRDARQLMVPRGRLAALDVATPLADVLRIVATSPYSRLPVYRRSLDDIIGILHTKHVVTHFLDRGRSGTLAALVRPILRVPDRMPADRLLGFLRERRSHQALVVDASDAVIGMITLEDVLGELLGSVPDEFKAPRLLPLRLTDGRVRLPGDLPLERARVWVEGAWPADDRAVADFVVGEAGRLPEPAEKIEIGGLEVEIESVENDRIMSVIVRPREEDDDEDEGTA